MITRRFMRPRGQSASASWVCPSCTRTSLLQLPQRRAVHSVPPLSYHEQFNQDGVPGLMSASGYQMAWTQRQSILVNRFNELIAGEPFENSPPKTLALLFARGPMRANIFNYASAAHNNHQFFQSLSLEPLPISKSPSLQESLEKTFGSMETLRMTMIDTAAAMFGPGFVWLVWARTPTMGSNGGRSGDWRVLTTYLAGTPYSEAGYRQQGMDMASSNEAAWQNYLDQQHLTPSNFAGAFGRESPSGREAAKFPPGGTNVMPVLCVSTWEHSWIYDFSLHGKRQFLEQWWKVIDWGVVDTMTPQEAKGALFKNQFDSGQGLGRDSWR